MNTDPIITWAIVLVFCFVVVWVMLDDGRDRR